MFKFETNFRMTYGKFMSVCIYMKLKYPIRLNTLSSQARTHTHTHTHTQLWENNHTRSTSNRIGYQMKSVEKMGSTSQQL
jgi:hypothetical protein